MAEGHTPEGEIATDVILATFRTNGLLLAAGDELTADLGLTSARWQVLGALPDEPLTVPQIARRMGLTRQSVHSTVKHLVQDGVVELVANPDHRRSQLVRLTDRGRQTLKAVDERQAEWVNALVAGLTSRELKTTGRVLTELCARLEAPRDVEGDER